MTSNNIIQNYKKYIVKRQQIRNEQRTELARRLEDYAYEIGRDFVGLKAEGRRVEDITAMLGMKNRTFLYDMERVFRSRESAAETIVEDEAPQPRYRVTIDGNEARVAWLDPFDIVQNEDTIYLEDNVVVSMPESWVNELDPKVRKLYREIVKEVNDATAKITPGQDTD